jgi:hypothetical protein
MDQGKLKGAAREKVDLNLPAHLGFVRELAAGLSDEQYQLRHWVSGGTRWPIGHTSTVVVLRKHWRACSCA